MKDCDEKEKTAAIIFNKYKKAKHRTSMILTGFIIFIVCGYALFFTSKVWYPDNNDLIKPSKMNVARQWGFQTGHSYKLGIL